MSNNTISPGAKPWADEVVIVQMAEPDEVAIVEELNVAFKGVMS